MSAQFYFALGDIVHYISGSGLPRSMHSPPATLAILRPLAAAPLAPTLADPRSAGRLRGTHLRASGRAPRRSDTIDRHNWSRRRRSLLLDRVSLPPQQREDAVRPDQVRRA